jgi:hypothetical protein
MARVCLVLLGTTTARSTRPARSQASRGDVAVRGGGADVEHDGAVVLEGVADARVLTCLFTTDAGSLSASQLAQRLQVSPASVSKAIAFLESQSLVRRERDERRRDRYVVDDELFYQATLASARANDLLVATARQGVAVLGPQTPAAARLENVARFLDFSSESITRAAEQGREVLHGKA